MVTKKAIKNVNGNACSIMFEIMHLSAFNLYFEKVLHFVGNSIT